jgi:hypothetical protein
LISFRAAYAPSSIQPTPSGPSFGVFSVDSLLQVHGFYAGRGFADVSGRRVRELVNGRRDRGACKVVWNGENDAGQAVASGVYFYKLVAGSFTDTKKLTILK